MKSTVIVDASFCPTTKAAAWAAWIRLDGRGAPIKKIGVFKRVINNPFEAELYAAFNAIWYSTREGADSILLQTDCLQVVQLINRKSCARWRSLINHVGPNLRVDAKHVKGHTTCPEKRSWVNRWCDEKARAMMRAERGKLRHGH